ncbi:hypothetical protein L1887_29232 [Cichorium endivia]|nr:hypothetical protein L1887_29232 [Cichorium endivia]
MKTTTTMATATATDRFQTHFIQIDFDFLTRGNSILLGNSISVSFVTQSVMEIVSVMKHFAVAVMEFGM